MAKSRLIRRALVAATAASLAGTTATLAPSIAAGHGDATSDHADPSGALTPAQRRVIREATARYRHPDAAVAAGYVPTDVCEADPAQGGMGYHYGRAELLTDALVDPTQPEVLVYAPDRDGELRLAAIEYLAVDADGDLATDDDRPTLFGEPFDGPMPGHVPGQPVHYDIHAWLWRHNPAGELAPFNPTLTCPPAGS